MRFASRFLTLGIILLCGVQPSDASVEFADPLDVPSLRVPHPEAVPILALARAGTRIIGVGLRGCIIASDDGGRRWVQEASPVQIDLTAVSFASPEEGWAVGHDSVILHTSDAGRHWRVQVDGRKIGARLSTYYKASRDPAIAKDLAQLSLNFGGGPSLPFLDVRFLTREVGYAVGPFGILIRTENGGDDWKPWLEHVDNSGFLNLDAIQQIGDALYIAGEQGRVYRFDATTQRFTQLQTGYDGTFFGLIGFRQVVIAFGLKGNVYRSGDGGVHWNRVLLPSTASVTSGIRLSSGRYIIGNAAGEIYSSADDRMSFKKIEVNIGSPITNILESAFGNAIYSSFDGVGIISGE